MITSHCLACSVGITAAKADWTNCGLETELAGERLAEVDFAAHQRSGFVVVDTRRRAVVGRADLERPACKIAGGATLAGPVLVGAD